jgi:hypothetical protein
MFKKMVEKADGLMKGDNTVNDGEESPILYAKRTRAHTLEINKKRKTKLPAIVTARPTPPSQGTNTPPLCKGLESPRDGGQEFKDEGGQVKKIHAVKEYMRADWEAANTNRLPEGWSKVIKTNPDVGITRRMSGADVKEGNPFDRQKMPPPPPPAAKPLPGSAKASGPSSKNAPTVKNAGGKAVSAPSVKHQAYHDILEFLELHYIRSRPDMEARDLIYGKDVCGMSSPPPVTLSPLARATPGGSSALLTEALHFRQIKISISMPRAKVRSATSSRLSIACGSAVSTRHWAMFISQLYSKVKAAKAGTSRR